MPIEFCLEFTISNLSWIIRFPAAMPHPQVFSCLGNRKLGNGKGGKGGRERGRWMGSERGREKRKKEQNKELMPHS